MVVKMQYLGEYIGTKRSPDKRSFFDTTEEEFSELAQTHDIPVQLLKDIALYEKAYIENRQGARWNAWKKAYLPRFLYKWI